MVQMASQGIQRQNHERDELTASPVEQRVIKTRSEQEIRGELKEIDKQIDEAEEKWSGTEKETDMLLPLYRKWKKVENELRDL